MHVPAFAQKLLKKPRPASLVVLVLLAAFAVFLVWFNQQVRITPINPQVGVTYEKARVVEVLQDNLQEDGSRVGSQLVKLELTTGSRKGTVCEATSLDGYLYGATCQVGTRVIVQVSTSGDSIVANVYNYDRAPSLYLLLGLFLLVLVLVGGLKGLKSGLSLCFTLACVIFLYLPMLYIGASPFWSAVLVTVLTTPLTMYFLGGNSVKSLCADLGTLIGVVAAGLTATLFGYLGHISGYNVDNIDTLLNIGMNSNLQVGGILFSGMLISSLGAVMDVSISVASAVSEIYEKNPGLSPRALFVSGLHVGRDMIAGTSTTLILAFTGSSVTLLVSLYAYQYQYRQIINMYSIGIDILQGLSGAIGLVLAVPCVSAISALLLPHGRRRQSAPPDSAPQRPACTASTLPAASAANVSDAVAAALAESGVPLPPQARAAVDAAVEAALCTPQGQPQPHD